MIAYEPLSIFKVIRSLFVLVTAGVGIGIVMSVISNGFVRGVAFLTDGYSHSQILTFDIFGHSLSFMPLLIILLAAVILIWVRGFVGLDRFYGPADSIYAAHRTDNELDVKRGLASTFSAFISASGGASVGQYGPLVHFGATIGSYLKQVTRSTLTTDVFIGCGVAGAIAAGFNAPIAGILFAHEAVIRHFSLRAVTPIAISSLVASSFSQYIFGDFQVFEVALIPPDLLSVVPLALMLGPIFGLTAIVMMVSIRKSTQWGVKSGLGYKKLTLLAAFICGSVGLFVPEILGLGGDTVQDILSGSFDASYLLVLLIAKILMSAICLGLGMFGGVFSPALFIGATAGGLAGMSLSSLVSGDVVLALIVAGMGAVCAPVIGAPITVVVIILEMTMSYELALFTLGSVVTSALTASMLFGYSFFDRQLLDRDIDIKRGRGHIGLMETPVSSVMTSEYVSFDKNVSVTDVIDGMVSAQSTEAYLLNDDGTFFGKVTLNDLVRVSGEESVAGYGDINPQRIKHDDSLQQAIEIASDFIGESIPIIDIEKKRLMGVVSEADIFQGYLNLQSNVVDLETR